MCWNSNSAHDLSCKIYLVGVRIVITAGQLPQRDFTGGAHPDWDIIAQLLLETV